MTHIHCEDWCSTGLEWIISAFSQLWAGVIVAQQVLSLSAMSYEGDTGSFIDSWLKLSLFAECDASLQQQPVDYIHSTQVDRGGCRNFWLGARLRDRWQIGQNIKKKE